MICWISPTWKYEKNKNTFYLETGQQAYQRRQRGIPQMHSNCKFNLCTIFTPSLLRLLSWSFLFLLNPKNRPLFTCAHMCTISWGRTIMSVNKANQFEAGTRASAQAKSLQRPLVFWTQICILQSNYKMLHKSSFLFQIFQKFPWQSQNEFRYGNNFLLPNWILK